MTIIMATIDMPQLKGNSILSSQANSKSLELQQTNSPEQTPSLIPVHDIKSPTC
jgi:hypothetical protein